MLIHHRAEIVRSLSDLEWAADRERPDALVRDPAAVRPRVELFLDSLISGLRDGDWRSFDENIAARTEVLLRAGIRSADDLNQRSLVMVGKIAPFVLREPDPAEVIVALFSMLLSAGGRIVARHHADLLEDSRRLDDVKSMFLRLTTHELRAPLGTVRGYASMLEEGDLGELPDAARTAVRGISKAADVAHNLIEQLVEVSRLDIGREALSVGPTRMSEAVETAAELVRREADAADITLAVDVSEAPIEVDRDRLVVAIRNLLSNAIKYGPHHSRVEVVGRIEDGVARFTVTDEGPGIAAEELPRIFERYYRSVRSRSVAEGSGLGLYITRRIAELHGGGVEVTSTPGVGSTFRLYLPQRAPTP